MNRAVFGLLLALSFPVTGNTADVAEPVPGVAGFHPVGSGQLTWFGLTVYEATLYAPDGSFQAERPFALRIDYRFKFSREQLAQSSIEEIEKIHGKRADKELLLSELESVFRDVREGDHIIGVYNPGEGAAFYSDHRLLGRIDNPETAQAFFSIWLSPNTPKPDLRAQLLGDRG